MDDVADTAEVVEVTTVVSSHSPAVLSQYVEQ
jgi:hypothetical protein